MNLIVAVDKNWAIGYKGDLLISIPEDMKFFRETTMGKVCIMGKNTLESLPGGRPLKNRINIVIALEKDYKVDGATVVYSIEEALKEASRYNTNDVYVIGGGSIYKQMLPYCDIAYVTYVDYAYAADTFLPNLDEMEEWTLAAESEECTYFDVEYYFRRYEKK
ncbi:MAG: dihydrofolate reductase [Eubacterium sp.]